MHQSVYTRGFKYTVFIMDYVADVLFDLIYIYIMYVDRLTICRPLYMYVYILYIHIILAYNIRRTL